MKASENHTTGRERDLEGRPRAWWSAALGVALIVYYLVAQIGGRLLEKELVARGLEAQQGDLGSFISFGLFALVAAVLVWLVPRNPVAWVFAAVIVFAQLSYAGLNYGAYHAQVEPLPAGSLFAWLGNWTWFLTLVPMVTYLPLYFPTGRLVSRRWRWVVVLTSAGLTFVCARFALAPGRLESAPIENPMGVQFLEPYLGLLDAAGGLLLLPAALLSLASAIVRFRRARGEERQQIRWFVVGMGLFISSILIAVALESLLGDAWGGGGDFLFGLFSSLVPLSAGMAILKYRLYAIDTVINRILVYGVLSALLVGIYVAIIVAFQVVLEPLTKQSDMAVAISTLAAAAAFRPLRTRVQGFIDRRFYRHKYDSTKLLASFSGHLRDEVDLDAAHSGVVALVRETMQPQHASLWIKDRGTAASIGVDPS